MAEERLTLDSVLRNQGKVGRVLHHRNGKVYFEYVRPIDDAPKYLPHGIREMIWDGSKTLLVLDPMKQTLPSVMFAQEEDAAYLFADPEPISPNQNFIGVLKLVGWSLVPGIFDVQTGTATFFEDIFVYNNILFPTFSWLSDNEILLLTKEQPGDFDRRLSIRGHGPQEQARAREDAWRRKSVTASVLGAGKYSRPEGATPSISLVKIDIRSGERKVILTGPRLGMNLLSLSPSKRFLFTSYLGSNQVISDGQNAHRSSAFRHVVIDLSNLEVVDLSEKHSVRNTPYSWSPTKDQLLFTSEAHSDVSGEATFYVLDPHTQSVRSHAVSGVALSRGSKEAIKRRSRRYLRASWLNDEVFVFAQTTENDARIDWVGVNTRGDSTVLTKKMAKIPDRPIARSEEEFFFLVDGDVVGVNSDGEMRNLTENFSPLRVQEFYRKGTGYDIPQFVGKLPRIEEVVFVAETMGREHIVFLDLSGSVTAALGIPADNTDLHTASQAAISFSVHQDGRSSEFHHVAATTEDTSNEQSSVWGYNGHLEGVETTGDPYRIEYSGPGGQTLFGWLFLPPGFTADRESKNPLVVIAYAETIYPDQFSDDFDFYDNPWSVASHGPISVQLYTSAGYAVLLPSIPLNWAPSDPLVDMMPLINGALDASIDTGYVDESRLALAGHSFGGYTALSVAVQSNRFDAIIAAAAPSNLVSRHGSFAEPERFHKRGVSPSVDAQSRMAVGPWVDEERYIRNSPIFHAENVNTPLLLIHGDLDHVAMAQAEEMFTALAQQDKDSQLVRYWGEAHSIYQPQNRRDMWKRIFDFLEDNGVTPGPKTVH